jgi:hypothetical protein
MVMNEEICALDHADNIDSLIARSGAILNFATHELLQDQRTIVDDHVARLLWQVEENLKSLKMEADALWEKARQGKQ